jgi:hypothetical protein
MRSRRKRPRVVRVLRPQRLPPLVACVSRARQHGNEPPGGAQFFRDVVTELEHHGPDRHQAATGTDGGKRQGGR